MSPTQSLLKWAAAAALVAATHKLLTCPCPTCVGCAQGEYYGYLGAAALAVIISNTVGDVTAAS